MPAPPPANAELSMSRRAGARNQKLMLFRRGKAMSGLPSIRGMSQLPKPPMRTGITMKKIMIKA